MDMLYTSYLIPLLTKHRIGYPTSIFILILFKFLFTVCLFVNPHLLAVLDCMSYFAYIIFVVLHI